jgi:chromosome segregation ATPase
MVVEQLRKGDKYGKIKPVIAIVIADHSLITEESDYHNVYHLANKKSHKAFSKLLEIHTIELEKLTVGGDGTLLGNWIRFLTSKTEKEFKMVAKTDPMIKKAVELLEQLSQDEELRAEAQQRAKALSDYNTLMEEARDEGVQEERERSKQKLQKAQERSKQEIQKIQERAKQELQEERERAKQELQEERERAKQELQEKQERAKQELQEERERAKQELQEEQERAKEKQERTAHIMKEQNLPLQIIADALGLTLEEVEGL